MTFPSLDASYSAVPLAAVPTIVLDTETTGLNPADDRIVQIGAVRLAGGQIADDVAFDVLINPGLPIPAQSTSIHGICDADVAGAERFAAVMPRLARWHGQSLMVGYSIGFDVTVLKYEHERHGLAWARPRTLDVRQLFELVVPNLPVSSLEAAADWLEVDVSARHTAVGDAVTTAKVYLALLPLLAKAGHQSLAQVERACMSGNAGRRALEAQSGWEDVVQAGRLIPASVADYARIDSFPYRHRISDMIGGSPQIVAPETKLREALAIMMRDKISSVFVAAAATTDEPGILTERDVLRALDSQGAAALDQAAKAVATFPLATIAADDFVYRAIVDMARRGTRHLGVHDNAGNIVGAITARDLLKQRAGDAIALGDSISHAATAPELGRIWSELTTVARGLVYEDVDSRHIAAVISRELRELTKRACEIAARDLLAAGKGPPPARHAVLVLGSGGRGESLLAMDQDNAILFDEGEPGGATDQWFEAFGTRVADILDQVGVAYCQGGVMAKNAAWRMSEGRWHEMVSGWIGRSRPEDILNADIFFDLRAVHGDLEFARHLRRTAIELATGAAGFHRALATSAARFESPFGLFGGYKTQDGRIDLKKCGLFPIVSTARVLALRYGLSEHATPARLAAAKLHIEEQAHVADALIQAHKILLDESLRQQLRDLDSGLKLSNSVKISDLSKHRKQQLRWALEQIPGIANLLGTPLFAAA